MSDRVTRFIEAIDECIMYFRKEYEMTYAEALGCLEAIKFDLLNEMKDQSEDADDGKTA